MSETNVQKKDLLSLDLNELTAFLKEKGQPSYRAKSIFKWMHLGVPFEEMTDQPARLREELERECVLHLPTVRRRLVSKLDGTVKYLFELHDGCTIESVFMKYEHGNTVCLSSQAGCRMGCRFCASHIGGFERSLLPSEMLGQVIAISKDMGERVDNLVLMGIGEPLDNYDNVLKFLRLVTAPGGLNIGARHISLSTCGIVPNIDRLAGEGMQITLSVSLHAADDAKRSEIMPVNRKWGIGELLAACRRYFDKTGRRISFEYALIAGVNDNRSEALTLAALLKKSLGKMPIHVNLIPVNEVKESGFHKSSRKQVDEFAAALKEKGINATVRRKLGSDIDASCGQLRMNEKSLLNLE